ncbi:hypothetical protein ACFX2H_008388 [Malus domestica]
MLSVTHDNHVAPISIASIMHVLVSHTIPSSPHGLINPILESITATSTQYVPPTFHVAIDLSSGSNSHDSTKISIEFQLESLQVILSILPMNTHAMQTRSKTGIFKPKVFLSIVADEKSVELTQVEPSTYKSAIKSSVWCATMEEELLALHSQGTWSLVPLPANKNLVGCKWVFKIKRNVDGTISR